ncbi:hypothetical protein CTAYLR_006150 [Chrysophaeum taylorii]|uniref:Cell division control protein n=1 Tax=Chrysophaeum taylorii TaxID=2483200 RepID=A0AAD7UNA6_9STRA|nr:hypothetical protein CTAYLR_006150 [Chrysophaeum taylorii]
MTTKKRERDEDSDSDSESVVSALQLSHVPSVTKHRESESKRIWGFLEGRVREQAGGTLYVCGGPGTGKTLHVERARAAVEGMEISTVRGTSFANGEALMFAVARALAPPSSMEKIEWARLSAKECVAEFEAKVLRGAARQRGKRRNKVFGLVVDEIDSLVAVAGDATRRLFAVAARPENRFALVGIANAIDLPQRALGAKPSDTVVFEPYTFLQLRDIVADRAGDKFEAKALELAARKVAAQTGDARKVLDICAKAVRLASGDGIATIRHVVAALKDSAASPACATVQTLPVHARVALAAAIRLSGAKGHFSRKDLFHAYQQQCPGLKADMAADEALALLEATGLLEAVDARRRGSGRAATTTAVKRNRRNAPTAARALRLAVDPQDVQPALGNLPSA